MREPVGTELQQQASAERLDLLRARDFRTVSTSSDPKFLTMYRLAQGALFEVIPRDIRASTAAQELHRLSYVEKAAVERPALTGTSGVFSVKKPELY